MPPVTRIEVFEFTVPAETTEAAPAIQQVEFDPGTVQRWTLVVPDGPAGTSGVQIRAFGTQLVPNTPGRWLISNDEKISSTPANWPNSGHLELAGYNEDSYEHTYELRLELTENVAPPKLVGAEMQPLATTPTGEVAIGSVPSEGVNSEPGGGLLPAEAPPPSEGPQSKPGEPSGGQPEPSGAEPVSSTEVPEGSAPETPVPETPEPGLEAPPPEPPPGTEPGEGAPGLPEVIAQEPQPETEGSERRPSEPGSRHPKTKYVTTTRTVHTKPATGLDQVASAISGHPEVHMGAAIATNLMQHYWPRLLITSTTGGHHAPNSLHYKGEAVDLASSDGAYMDEAAKWAADHLGRYLTEGIHNPDLSISGGQDVPSTFWGAQVWGEHTNHIHIGVAPPEEEALVKANRPGTKKVKERKATNPAKRKKAPGHGGTKKTTKRKAAKHHAAKSHKRAAAHHAPKHHAPKRHKATRHKASAANKRRAAKAAEKRKAKQAAKRKASEAAKKAAKQKAEQARKAAATRRRRPAAQPHRRRR